MFSVLDFIMSSNSQTETSGQTTDGWDLRCMNAVYVLCTEKTSHCSCRGIFNCGAWRL